MSASAGRRARRRARRSSSPATWSTRPTARRRASRPTRVDAAARRIDAALDEIGAGPDDLALTQGAAGGDLLFAEACLARARAAAPVAAAGASASSSPRRCCRSSTARRGTRAFAPSSPASTSRRAKRRACSARSPPGDDAFVRANLWLLESALAFGAERLRCICLWDGGGGDGPGGTRHLVDAVRAAGGRVVRIDSNSL